ncbi:MAG: tryptophan synthase subunit alpha [Peptococcaceae bacterium]|jgi:tryptophan synthase alpha chain|nr:tryptophan synthase subunit alpha [Peptococcaceae bacterium]
MNRIEQRFRELAGQKALITYLTAGDPDLAATGRLVRAMERAGADLVELGLPFSDPVADGPVIQRASQRSLAKGTGVKAVMALAARLRSDGLACPLLFMTYYNPVLQYGLAEFARDAAAAGVDGLIIPDLPREEAGPLLDCCLVAGLLLIPLVAPTSIPGRLPVVLDGARGFVYCVTVTGVTGSARATDSLAEMSRAVREHSSLPVAFGFGIATPADAVTAARHADAVVVGSAFVRLVEEYPEPQALEEAVAAHTAVLKQALRRGV